MLYHSASFAMSTSVPKALPGKFDVERYSPSIFYILINFGLNDSCVAIDVYLIVCGCSHSGV